MYGTQHAIAILAQQGGLTLHKVLVGIPHDPAAFVVYLCTAALITWVIRAGRKTHGASEKE